MEPPPFRLAKSAAKKSKNRFKMGAAIARNNTVLVYAANTHKTCPEFGSGPFKSMHAEGHAIKKAVRQGIDISGCDIYVYRQHERMAKPCKCCQALIDKYGIRNVFHT